MPSARDHRLVSGARLGASNAESPPGPQNAHATPPRFDAPARRTLRRWMLRSGDALATLAAVSLLWALAGAPASPPSPTWRLWLVCFPLALLCWAQPRTPEWPQAGLHRGLQLLHRLLQSAGVMAVLHGLMRLAELPLLPPETLVALGAVQVALGLAVHEGLWRWSQRWAPADSAPSGPLRPLPLQARLIKRAFDVSVASVALTLFLPWGLLIAALIKLESPGPVIFRQRRHGLGNRLFEVYKFRSMRFDPQDQRAGIRLTERGDARVTRVGDFLRRTSLDEFPQFFNVLLGDMSVVGPRPHPPGVKAGQRVYEEVVREFSQRYQVRPGITGWAQVSGWRGNTFTEEHLTQRYARDIEYIRHWSLALDVWIVLKTVGGGFGGRNAF